MRAPTSLLTLVLVSFTACTSDKGAADDAGHGGSGSAGTPAASNGGVGGTGAAGGIPGAGRGPSGGNAGSGVAAAGTFGNAGAGGSNGGAAGAGAASAGVGTGGTSAGASGDGGASAGLGGMAPVAGASGSAGSGAATWHAAVASGVSDALLASEYASWKTKHVQTCTDGSAVVKKDEGSVVSEGIGYGMLLAAAFEDRTLFDGLFQYYTDHADPKGLMNWSTGVCDAAGNNNAFAATDGDLDTAMALVQAAARWPDGSYFADAETLTSAIAASETELCDSRAVLRPGDNFGGCSDTNQARLNPSYFAPGYYRVFAAKFPAQAERWNALVSGSYDLYPLYQARMSGLVPDWAAVDGSDWYGASYSYDACRTPWRVLVDYAWSGEPKAKSFLQGITGWTDANGLGSLPNNSAFVGSFALAAGYDQAKLDAAVTSWLAGNGDDTPYFQGTLRVLYLLAAAGKFPSTL